MTHRLYYDDAYLKQFTATVTSSIRLNESESLVYLDQSAFYPTSGGQPYDTGSINENKVLDVFVDERGDVAHKIQGQIGIGEKVDCHIDWDRRFDHMQQHAGEHILAGSLYHLYGGHTIGLHIGHADSSIDVDLPNGCTHLDSEQLVVLENVVNDHITLNERIVCFFPDADAMNRLPLRKPPTVSEHIRVVQIGDWEYCACGGTHPSQTGEIALLKITDARPCKGKLRIRFVCGRRALLHYRQCMKIVTQLSETLSSEPNKIPDAANDLLNRLKNAAHEIKRLKTEQAIETVKKELFENVGASKITIIKYIFNDLHAEGLKLASEYICSFDNHVALLGSRNESGINLLFSKNRSVRADMGILLKDSLARFGGKGGGSDEFARGSTNNEALLDYAQECLLSD